MGRLLNWEAAGVIFGGLAVTLGLAWDSGAPWPALIGLGLLWLIASIPLAWAAQRAMIPLYLRWGRHERALELALLIRSAAPNRKFRDAAAIDIAMVHLSLGRFKDALRILESINAYTFKPFTQGLILGNRAQCRVHSGGDLEKALGEAQDARKVLPDEALLAYFEGLALHHLGRPDEALPLVLSSLEGEPDPTLPLPGERPLLLAQIYGALGDAAAQAEALERAAAEGAGGPFAAQIAAAQAPEAAPAQVAEAARP